MESQTYLTTRVTTVSSPGKITTGPRKVILTPPAPAEKLNGAAAPAKPPKGWTQRFGIESECFHGLVFVDGLISLAAAEKLVKEYEGIIWDRDA